MNGKTIFISGASRGIGRAIAIKLAAQGANIVIAAKSVTEDPRLGGTIHTVAEEVNSAGGRALAIPCDIREEDQILYAIRETISFFGGIDAVINNASAISLTRTEQTEAKKFDLMHDINVRGTFLLTKYCIPFLKKSENPHIITLSPPLNITPQWLGTALPYALSKFNMSMMAIGWAEELKDYKIASNSLWPKTTIATAAVKNLLGGEMLIQRSRKPEIIADAVDYILHQPSTTYTGQNLLDEDVLRNAGVSDFEPYSIVPGGPLQKDLFLD
ncbi:MAG: NAD(P)-dependent oxidoreductase [Chitinophagaceae bacterium]|nr:NAD(P)-dependent oxidoreductase [Chitinophagaceae bacterium]MCB9046391.1 NAD(P)-dependent oxidoreductase [Chitinophagales bacterium]